MEHQGRIMDAFAVTTKKNVPVPVGRITPGVNKKGHIQQVLWKTTPCVFFEKGSCKKGTSCSFAHGGVDTRVRPNLTKTVMCSSWQRRRACKAGDECKFAHGPTELRRRNGIPNASLTAAWNGTLDDTNTRMNSNTTTHSDSTHAPSVGGDSAQSLSDEDVYAAQCQAVPSLPLTYSPPRSPLPAVTTVDETAVLPDAWYYSVPVPYLVSQPEVRSPVAGAAVSEVQLLQQMFGSETSKARLKMMLEAAAPDHYED